MTISRRAFLSTSVAGTAGGLSLSRLAWGAAGDTCTGPDGAGIGSFEARTPTSTVSLRARGTCTCGMGSSGGRNSRRLMEDRNFNRDFQLVGRVPKQRGLPLT